MLSVRSLTLSALYGRDLSCILCRCGGYGYRSVMAPSDDGGITVRLLDTVGLCLKVQRMLVAAQCFLRALFQSRLGSFPFSACLRLAGSFRLEGDFLGELRLFGYRDCWL